MVKTYGKILEIEIFLSLIGNPAILDGRNVALIKWQHHHSLKIT
jgi:hypothetical protein